MMDDGKALSFLQARDDLKLGAEILSSIRSIESIRPDVDAVPVHGMSDITRRMIELLDDTDLQRQAGALEAIAIIAQRAVRWGIPSELHLAVPKICGVLVQADKTVRINALRALGTINAHWPDAEITKHLLKVAESEDEAEIATEAVEALNQSKDALPLGKSLAMLIERAHHEQVRCLACDIVGRIGEGAAGIILDNEGTTLAAQLVEIAGRSMSPGGTGRTRSAGPTVSPQLQMSAAMALCRVDPQGDWLFKLGGLDRVEAIALLLRDQGLVEKDFANNVFLRLSDLRRGPHPGYIRMTVAGMADYVYQSVEVFPLPP